MRSVRQSFWGAVVFAALAIGFVYNLFLLVNGPQGLRVLGFARADLAEAEDSLRALKEERRFFAQTERRLSRGSLDHDLLDERARRLLNLTVEGEYVLRADDLDHFLKAH